MDEIKNFDVSNHNNFFPNLQQSMDGVRNIKSQKLFILLEDDGEDKIRVINPNGEVLFIPRELFEDVPVPVSDQDLNSTFTPEQLSSHSKYLEKVRFDELVEKERVAHEKAEHSVTMENIHRETLSGAQHAPTKSKTTDRPRKSRESQGSGGIKATWTADIFVLYRHKIDPLKPKDYFCITVNGEGDYVIQKEDFLKVFNDVVMSYSYSKEGLYKFKETPDRAKKYLRIKS